MLDMLLKSIGYTPERLQNELAEFKGRALTPKPRPNTAPQQKPKPKPKHV